MSAIDKLISQIRKFQPKQDAGDLVWHFYPKIGRHWRHLWARQYKDSIYLGSDTFPLIEATALPAQKKGEFNAIITPYLMELKKIFQRVSNNPILYHLELTASLPPEFRTGIVSRKFVHDLIPGYMRFDKELSTAQISSMIQFLKKYKPVDPHPRMTVGLYFKYCRIAYQANPHTHHISGSDTGKAMYKKFADGRDEGLSNLAANNPEHFQNWYNERRGGHPWEIYRGGNSTHIDLYVRNDETRNAWNIHLDAFSSTRLAETCRIVLALEKAKLPFVLEHKDSFLKRLLAEDHIGILPEEFDLRYGWQNFPKELDVADTIHFSWFKDEHGKSILPLRKINNLVSWFPITPLGLRPDWS